MKGAWLTLSTPSPTAKPQLLSNSKLNCIPWVHRSIAGALSGALSFGFMVYLPCAIAIESPPLQSPLSPLPSTEVCRDVEQEQRADTGPEVATNESIVEDAWQIVNDTFLDTGRRPWSPETWQQRKGDILRNSIQTRSKAHRIIKQMLASLGDPYTRFLSPEEFSKMARYDMTGIGINLREFPDENGEIRLKVLGIILDGPADLAGVRQGDEVLAVNGVEVQGKSAFEVSTLLQGPNETYVTIQVKHGNCGPVESIQVQRQLVTRTPVFYRLEQTDNGATSVGYIRLKEFNALARKDLVIAMERLQDMGASYFILDLRDNLGGLVQAGIEIAKLFLREGDTVIYTVGRDPQFKNAVVADSSPLVEAPVIVLVNGKTASASEIVASALHDNCRAVLVGERTFGKGCCKIPLNGNCCLLRVAYCHQAWIIQGLIQSVFELDDGSGVVVTVGKYVTPNQKDINGNGIEPDFQKFPAWGDVRQYLSKCSMPQQG